TEDLGETWVELSGFGTNGSSSNGFPNVAVFSLIVMPHNTDVIWVGTEIGLFESTDGGSTWLFADNGLPAVCIWDMRIYGQQVVVGTHGRGVWTVDIPELPDGDIKRPGLRAGKNPQGNIAIEIVSEQAYDAIELYVDDVLEKTYNNTTVGKLSDEISIASNNTTIGIQVKAKVDMQEANSDFITVDNYDLNETVQKYMNTFTTNRNDFSGASFKISKELFNDWAIHTNHPYEEATQLTYVLSYPIEVLEENKAILSYRDIAFVEAGDPGTQFGDEKFWDYAVIEGSKDGINWIPLADGYDVSKSDKWQDAAGASNNYDAINDAPSSSDLFVEHSINLHATGEFTTGDVILIRFRLYSDANATGYGWVIDDLIIQETGTAVEGDMESEATFTVGPNPASDYIELKLDSEDRGAVNVTIYDMSGRAVVVRDYYKDTNYWNQTVELGQNGSGTMILTVTVNGKVYKKKIVCR
ncbi:MAG: T9SS type A sorting domain-containing protein, partial [Bacteroidales bacterium]|nr:T9SS type A sorting domain-containing protein [Bacteroidales bacterium]